MGAAGVGQGIGAAGSIAAGIQQIKESKYRARILRDNARIADQIAEQALWRGEHEALRHSQGIGQALGTQRAAIADAGFDPGFGTSLDILADTAAAGAADAVLIRYNAALEEWQARNEATNLRNQADLTKWAGQIKAHAGVAQSIGGSVGSLGQGTAPLQQGPRGTTLGSYRSPYLRSHGTYYP